MIALSLMRMSEESRNFASVMNQRLQSKSLASTIAMAKVIADNLEKSDDVSLQDIGYYFDSNLKVPVLGILSSLNEYFPVEYDLVENYVKKFYSIRHWLGNKKISDVYFVNEAEPVLSFFGVGQFLDKPTLECIRNDRVSITTVMNGTAKFLSEIGNVGV